LLTACAKFEIKGIQNFKRLSDQPAASNGGQRFIIIRLLHPLYLQFRQKVTIFFNFLRQNTALINKIVIKLTIIIYLSILCLQGVYKSKYILQSLLIYVLRKRLSITGLVKIILTRKL